MTLLDRDKDFLRKRKFFVRSWRYVGSGLILMVAGVGAWIYLRHPLLANPVYVAAELQRGGIDRKTVELLAVMLPIAIGGVFFLCLMLVLLAFLSFSNERKYLEVIAREMGDIG